MRHKRAGSEVYAGKWAWLGFLAPSLLGVLIFVLPSFSGCGAAVFYDRRDRQMDRTVQL